MGQKNLFGTLAFRVLLSSFVFLIVPLIFYALFVYDRDYEEKIYDIFSEMHLFQKDQLDYLLEIEQNNYNFLEAVSELILLVQDPLKHTSINKIDKIINRFTRESQFSALFYLTVGKDSNLICTSSSLKDYENINFTPYFDLNYLKSVQDKIFIGKDPVFGHSLFIVFPIKKDNDEITGFSALSLDLNKLVTRLDSVKKLYHANVSITDEDGIILASTAYKRSGKKIIETEKFNSKNMLEVIQIKQIEAVPHGYEFYLNNQKRFLTSIRLPHTKAKIVLTIPAKGLLSKLYKSLFELATLLAFILLFGTIISYLLALRFAKPLKQLSHVMEKVGQGDLTKRFQTDKMGFEINYLGDKFNEMVLSLINYIDEVRKEKAFKEAYQKELQIGKEIQQSLLPDGTFIFHGIQTALYFQPAKEVAGDFYDWIIKGDDLYITIADGVGKGISGCLYAFTLRSTLKACETIYDNLSEIAIKTNSIFCEDTKETGSFVTAFLAKYNPVSKEISYVNCGHNYPIIKRAAGNIERLETSGIAFGVELFDRVDVKKTKLETGDYLIFYTDGITDAQDTNQKLFGEKRLISIIETLPYKSPEELLSLINEEIALFTKGEPQYDDMTLMILKI